MNVSLVSSSPIAPAGEQHEARVAGRDRKNDHDSDDAVAQTPSTVNATGQAVGKLVNKLA